MKSVNNNMGLAIAVSAGIALTGLAPEALAHTTTKKHSHAPSTRSLVRADERVLKTDNARLSSLEAEVTELRSQLTAQKSAAEQVETKQQQLETQVAEEAAKENAKNNMAFFRGGYASLTSNRTNELLTSTNHTVYGNPNNGNGNGWYVGGGFDFRMTDDLWGATDLMALDTELMFEYQNFGQGYNSFVSNSCLQL